MTDADEAIEAARLRAERAALRLRNLVAAECPGTHVTIQHRDHKPPWCPACGRTNDGRKMKT